MTEEEARKHWCPFSRLSGGNSAFNRGLDGKTYDETNCIASECMAWRVNHEIFTGVAGTDIQRHQNSGGYCGLAGKP